VAALSHSESDTTTKREPSSPRAGKRYTVASLFAGMGAFCKAFRDEGFEVAWAWALMAMPFVNATEKLQFVGRYTCLGSDDVNGIRLGTYENRLVSGRGDQYQELYLGANYSFYGHKLKLQTGVQYADMNDRADDGGAYTGVSWTTGIRIGW